MTDINAGKIIIDTNVLQAGTGIYRVSLSVIGDKVPYVVLLQDLTIIIKKKDIFNAKPMFDSGTSGNLFIFGAEAIKRETISVKGLPEGSDVT